MEKGFFYPGIKFLNRFKYPTKIGIISIILLLFIGVLFFLIIKNIDERIQFTKKEKIGLEYIESVKSFLEEVQEHRYLTNIYFSGEKALKTKILVKNKEIENDISSVNKVRKENNYVLKTDKIWNQINEKWRYLEKNSLNLTPEENYKKHTDLINETIYLIFYISNVSNLVLDSRLDVYYLARSVSRNIPELTESIREANALGINIVTGKKIFDNERIALTVQTALIKDDLLRINQNSQVIFDVNKNLKKKLEKFIIDINVYTDSFLFFIDKEIIRTDKIKITSKDFYIAETIAINSIYRLYETEIHNLEKLLNTKIENLEKEKNMLIFFLLIVLSGITYIFASFVSALLISLKNLKKTALSVSAGKLDAEAEVYSKKDEMGSLSVSFNEMIKNLKTLMERELILREIIISSLKSQNTNEILRNIANHTGKILKVDSCFFVNYDFQKKEYLPVNPNGVYLSSLEVKNISGKIFSAEETDVFTMITFGQKQVLVVNDTSKIIIPEVTRALINEFGVKSFMAAPLFYTGNPIGLLIVDSVKNLREYTEEEQSFLETIANQSAIVINQANLTEKLQATLKRESLIRKIIETIRSNLDINEVKKAVVNEIGKAFNADRCYFRNFDKKTDKFLPPDVEYRESEEIKSLLNVESNQEGLRFFIEEARRKKEVLPIIATRSLIKEKHLEGSPLEKYFDSAEIKANYTISIWDRKEELTLLVLHYVKEEVELSEEDKELLTTLSKQILIAIEQASFYETIKKQSERESLLREIINNILESENIEKALELISEEIGKLFDAERVKIRNYYQDEKDFSEVVIEYRKNEQIPSIIDLKSITPKAVSKYMLDIIFNKKTFVADDIENSETPEEIKEFYRSISVKSVIVYPIFYKDTFLAVIIIENLTTQKNWEQEKLDLLSSICQQIALGINLFNLNEKLKKSLINEKILREIIIETRKFNEHDGIYNYLLNQLANLFKPNRCMHLHRNNNLFVANEVIIDKTLQPLLNQPFLSAEFTQEILSEDSLHVSIVKDVNQEISSPELKEFLINNKIQSYLLYSTTKICQGRAENEILGTTIICYPEPKVWASDEIEFFKLIVDTISIIFLEFKQRTETEEIKRTFIATLTHDLRSPIIAEQKALEAMISKKINYLNENYDEYLEDIYKTNKGLLRIVNNLLSVYHYETGKSLLNKEETNIKDLIDESVISLKYLAADKESQIYIDITEDLPFLNIDRDEIARVFSNLIGNAVKHTRKGTRIEINALKKDDFIEFAIRDNGEGIPKDHIDTIFQRYPVEKRKIGTGLGLYLSKQIIEAHGGKIWFETEEGVGTTFYFTLPL